MIQIIKKDKTIEEYNPQKIINAVHKAASRAMDNLTDNDYAKICNRVENYILEDDDEYKTVEEMHNIVEHVLTEMFPNTAKEYKNYRNYKKDFVHMLDKTYQKSQSIRYLGDRDNANSDSSLVSTQRSLIYNDLNRRFYKKFFLNQKELEAVKDGYIYIHDMSARLDTMNCCLANIKEILTGGFEMGNVWYNEPKTIDVAFDVVSDIIISMAAMQYGGFTACEVDKLLEPYAEKSYKKYYNEYFDNIHRLVDNGIKLTASDSKEGEKNLEKLADEYATKKVYRDIEQGVQAWEYRFNTVGSSRGDYPFISVSFGLNTSKFGRMISEVFLKTRMKGQGKEGFKKVVLFPKLTFLYDENLHGEGKELEYLFDIAIDCSSKAMYPDFLSLTGEGYIPSVYKKYGKVISLMGCRASLSPWYERGGMTPADENDVPVFEGRFNMGRLCPVV